MSSEFKMDINIKVAEIPHGHGRSFKLGIAASLTGRDDVALNDLPNGHEHSYQRGREFGDELVRQIANAVR